MKKYDTAWITAAALGVFAFSGIADSVIVQWGEPGGDSGIVMDANENFFSAPTTYTSGTDTSPASNYYANSTDRTPAFNAVHSVSANAKYVANDDSNGDALTSAKNQKNYRAMFTWETDDFLSETGILQGLFIETALSHANRASNSLFRFVIELDDVWYAGAPTATTADYTAYSIADAAAADWFAFTSNGGTPEGDDIDNFTFATTASTLNVLAATNINTVGFYSEFDFGTNTVEFLAHRTRYFQATTGTAPQPLTSCDTGYTIQKVRTAQRSAETFIVGSSYEGALLAMDYDGTLLWTNELSGTMNHDLWCGDITGDDTDEILAASADGSVYCLNADGVSLWQFKPNEGGHLPPMYAVCIIHSNSTPYVVCGGYDKNIYYLDSTGTLIKTIESSTYSQERPWGDDDRARAGYAHNANFLRPIPQSDGSEILALQGTCNHMQARGSIYQFEPLADLPFQTNAIGNTDSPDMIGEFRAADPDGDGVYEILMGTSGLGDQGGIRFDPVSGTYQPYPLTAIGDAGYRVTQTEAISDRGTNTYFMICGTHIVLRPSLDTNVTATVEKIAGTYAYNDMWKDDSGRILLASAQSGGSAIHIIDPAHPDWKTDFANLNPPGKIQTILANTESVWTQLETFTKPAWERDPVSVTLTSANNTHPVATNIMAHYDSPVFLGYTFSSHVQDPLDWDRSTVLSNNPVYRDKRDGRKIYDWTQSQVLSDITPEVNSYGFSMWGGHGNDPYYYSPETLRKIIDASNGKKTVLIWPEMNGSTAEFERVMDHLFYPLADYARTNNANIFVRNKNVFWQGSVYLPAWARMVAGDFSDVFVSGLEETSDKAQEMSIAGRMGLWASGALDQWGMRCSRDNPSFDRQRQYSYQRLPNHFLRNMVYNLAGGASVLNITYVDEDYMSLAWQLVAQGALFVPTREEIVSFNPVHLSITDPDEHYLDDGENNKWTTFYDRDFEENNPFVFSRLNGTWPAAVNTDWDFSRYAAGVKDRRQNFLPPYKNGLVLVTPPQHGVFADTNAVRGAMTDHLHPLYKSILQEFITDGQDYLSADGTTRYAADTYFQTLENQIQAGAEQLPLTVSGDVAWVCAQTDDTHLRLTLVDSGYLNPEARTATVTFHTVNPIKVTDLLDHTVFPMVGDSASIDVPLGLFRFIDIELDAPFFPENGWGGFASEHGLTGQPAADYDADGLPDLAEYGLGGDPTNPTSNGNDPYIEFGTTHVSWIHPTLTDPDAGITYLPEWTDNLVTGFWSNTWSFVTNHPVSAEFDETELQLPQQDHLFFRLRISQP
jgi:hypothetical protein